MHRLGSISLVVALGLLLASCGSSTPGTAGGSASVNPSAPAASNDAASPPDETVAPSVASTVGGGGTIPTIAEGRYTAGKSHFEISGEASETVDADLAAAASVTAEGLTLLSYSAGSGATGVVAHVVFNPDLGPSISYQSAKLVTAGGVPEGCHVELTKNDASGLAGTFSCTGLDALVPGAVTTTKVNVNGTFSANR